MKIKPKVSTKAELVKGGYNKSPRYHYALPRFNKKMLDEKTIPSGPSI